MKARFDNKQVVSSLIWKWLERSGSQVVQFIVQLILARILMPEEYGLISLVSIFIIFGEIFVQGGLNTAIIQKKDVDDEDFTSIFLISLVVAIFVYIILFLSAPSIALFFNEVQLDIVLRVLGLNLIIGVFNSIQNAYIARNLKFKLNFLSSMIAISISGVIGVILALKGFGVWALVFQQLINQFLISVSLYYFLRWKPKFKFSLDRVKILFGFGSHVLGANLIARAAEQGYGLVIGKVYSSSMLGFYYRGHQFPQIIVNNLNGAISSVLLPILSSEQDNPLRFKSIIRKSVVISGIIVFPSMIGLASIAKPLVTLILTDKWLFSVPFIQFGCLYYLTIPILSASVQANRALGRSDISFKLEILKAILTIGSIAISIPFGIYVMLTARIIISLIMLFISSKVNEKLIDYKFSEMLFDLMPSFTGSALMGGVVYFAGLIRINIVFVIIIQLMVGCLVYIAFLFITSRKDVDYILNIRKLR